MYYCLPFIDKIDGKELQAYLYLFIYRVDINCAQAGNNNYLEK